jgi:hypothetical protein
MFYLKMSVCISNKRYDLKIIKAYDLLNSDLNTPEFQRLVDEKHVDDLFNYQINHYKKYGDFFFTQPLIFCKTNEKTSIIDGQHRLSCINRLRECKYDNFNIYVTIIHVNNDKEMEERYKIVNMNKPVPIYEAWPFLKRVEKFFRDNYKPYLSHSDNPNFPNINVDKLIEYIDKKNININDPQIFINEIKKLNSFYKNKKDLYKIFNNFSKKLEKTKSKQDNYLMLSFYKKFEWVDRIIFKLHNNVSYQKINHQPLQFRVRIPRYLRLKVWNKRNKKTTGKCFISNEHNIDIMDFECGHIISVFLNGKTTIDNLEPICSVCNKDMGTKNLLDYKKHYNSF